MPRRKENKKLSRFRRILFGTGIAGLVFLVSAYILLVIFAPQTPKQKIMTSCKRLKSISAALNEYAADYNGYFPDRYNADGLEQLRKNNYLTEYKAFTSPLAKKVTVGADAATLIEENVSYIYFAGFTNKDNPDMPLVFEKLHNYDAHVGHYSKFICILLCDGRVLGYSGSFKNYTDIIALLKKKYSYSAEDIKRLDEKAARLDGK